MDSNVDQCPQRLFPTKRISSIKTGILTFLYIPIGTTLTILRLCLLLNFIIAGQLVGFIFPENSIFLEVINRIFMAVLGMWVKIDGKPSPSTVIVSNKRSNMDGIILSHSMNIDSEDEWGLHPYLCRLLNLVKKEKIFEETSSSAGKTKPVIVFPEGSTTSGAGVMKFQTSYFTRVKRFQSSSLVAHRVLSVSLSTAHSGFWGDLLWTFFCPMTFYNITFSEKCIGRDEDMEADEFAEAAASEVASLLCVPTLEISSSDKEEFLKRLKVQRCTNSQKVPPNLWQMAERVKEVTPHVPRDVILGDLSKTNSVDVTITNILEGVVKFDPIEPESKKKGERITSTQTSPQSLLERRKAEMYELARKRYREKHGL